MAEHSSQLFARNVQSLLDLFVAEDGALKLDFEDEIVAGACMVRDGEIVHAGAKAAVEAAPMILASVLTTNLAILVLAGFIGFVVISKVPNTLHTPLMAGTNAIHGIVLLGGLLLVGLADRDVQQDILVIAVAFGTINIVGGFLVTDRMLEMFKSRPKPGQGPGAGATRQASRKASRHRQRRRRHAGSRSRGERRDPPRGRTSCRARASSTSSTSSPSRCSSRACAGCRGRRRRCAAIASPPSAWRSR